MKRAKTGSYVVEVPLKTSKADEQFLNHCRYLGLLADHCMVKEANRRLNKYYRDPEVSPGPLFRMLYTTNSES